MDCEYGENSVSDRISTFIDRLGEVSDAVHDVCMLRAAFPERFRRLVCTHLSHLIEVPPNLLLELKSTDRRRRSPFKRRSGDRARERSSSRDRDQWRKPRDIQEKINKLIEYLLGDKSHYCVEGIFRLSGSKCRQRELEALIYSGSVSSLEFGLFSPIDLSCTLKKLLQDRAQPLLTQALVPYYLQLGRPIPALPTSLEGRLVRAKRIKAARLLTQMLPKQNRTILMALLRLVDSIVKSPVTRMTTVAMARILAPCLLAPVDYEADWLRENLSDLEGAASLLIDHADSLFYVPVSFLRDVSLNLGVARRRLPKDESDTEQSMTEDEDEDGDDEVIANVRFCSSPRGRAEIAIESLTDLAAHVQRVTSETKVPLPRRSSSGKRLSDFFKSVVDKEHNKEQMSPNVVLLNSTKRSTSMSAKRACPTMGSPLCTRSVQNLNGTITPKKGFGFHFRLMKTTPVKPLHNFNTLTPLKALPFH